MLRFDRSARRSDAERIAPVGLWGVLTTINFVEGVTRRSSSSRSKRKPSLLIQFPERDVAADRLGDGVELLVRGKNGDHAVTGVEQCIEEEIVRLDRPRRDEDLSGADRSRRSRRSFPGVFGPARFRVPESEVEEARQRLIPLGRSARRSRVVDVAGKCRFRRCRSRPSTSHVDIHRSSVNVSTFNRQLLCGRIDRPLVAVFAGTGRNELGGGKVVNDRLRVEAPVVAGQAFPGSDVELPAVKCAGQDLAVEVRPKRVEIRFEVGAAALNAVAAALPGFRSRFAVRRRNPRRIGCARAKGI